MKVVFITDLAAIEGDDHRHHNYHIPILNMVKSCILQILNYLQRCNTHSINPRHNQIFVGFKFCHSEKSTNIAQNIMRKNKKFHRFDKSQNILDQFCKGYYAAKTAKSPTKPSANPIQNTPKQTRSVYNKSHSNSPTPSTSATPIGTQVKEMSKKLCDQTGLAQVIIALSQSLKQFNWSETFSLRNNLNHDDNDAMEPQIVFIIGSISKIWTNETKPSNGDKDKIKHESKWREAIKFATKKSIAVHFIHASNGNDQTEEKDITAMDACLRRHSPPSIGVIPLKLLWMAPLLQLDLPFIQMFKLKQLSKANQSLSSASNGFWCKLSQNRLYHEEERWSGTLCILNRDNVRPLRSNNMGRHHRKENFMQCGLYSIECNRWRKYANSSQQTNLNETVYEILKNNQMNEIYMAGILEENEFQKMDNLPYISLIIRP